MSHLRKRATRIHQKLGTAGFVVACVALVAALGGTALAAKGLFTKAQEKKIAQIARKYATAGPQGPAGPAGPAGANGSSGEKGATGEKGAAGTNGASAEATPFSGPLSKGSVTCQEGGIEVKSASGETLVCNGEAGSAGTNGTNGKSVTVTGITAGGSKCGGRAGAEVKQEGAASGTEVCEGSPWTAGGTLPSGATETGTWGAFAGSKSFEFDGVTEFWSVAVPIAFPVHLAAPLASANVIVVPPTGSVPAGCTGTVEAPGAASGNLCVFEDLKSHVTGVTPIKPGTGEGFSLGIGRAGGLLLLHTTAKEEEVEAFGTWAVTG